MFLFSVPVRLGGTGGQTKAEGYVEALGLNLKWGGICEDGFSMNAAHIICKMLGYESALHFGEDLVNNPQHSNYVLDDLMCYGGEDSIFDCDHEVEWQGVCQANKIAGIRCKQSKLSVRFEIHTLK